MEARSIEPDYYVLLTADGKSQMYLIKNIAPEGIYISPLIDSTQRVLLTSESGQWKVQGSVIDYKIEFSSKENPPLIFSGVLDVDIEILNNLDDDSLESVCLTNEQAADLCRKDEVWERRFTKYFPGKGEEKPTDVTWKDYYFELKKTEGMFYIVMFNFSISNDPELAMVGVFKKKESAARGIVKEAFDQDLLEGTSHEGIEKFGIADSDKDLTKDELIQHIIDKGGMVIADGIEYRIFEHNEADTQL